MVEHQVILGEFIQSCHTKFVPPKKGMKGKKTYPFLLLQPDFANLVGEIDIEIFEDDSGNHGKSG